MEELSRKDLYEYLRTIQKAAGVQNSRIDPKEITEEEWADFCMGEGAARLAEGIIQRYGLAIPDIP